MVSPELGNRLLGVGDGITCFYNSILELIQKKSILHKVTSDCVVERRNDT